MYFVILDGADVSRILLSQDNRVRLKLTDLETINPKGDFRISSDAAHSDNVPKTTVPFPEKLTQLGAFEELVVGHSIMGRASIILNMIVRGCADTSLLTGFVQGVGPGGTSGGLGKADRPFVDMIKAERDSISLLVGSKQKTRGCAPRSPILEGEFEISVAGVAY